MGTINSTQIRPPEYNNDRNGSFQERSRYNNQKNNIDIKEKGSSTEIIIKAFTWHRDSHGLFDYESKNITTNILRCNYSTSLFRIDNDIIFEELKSMGKSSNSAATVLEKDSNYWIYHKNVVEDPDEEKLNPAEKAWLIVKYINNTNNFSTRGYKIRIGDTLKFGRVRFKVIMMQNEADGELHYTYKQNNKNGKRLQSPTSNENTESDNEHEAEINQNDFEPRQHNLPAHISAGIEARKLAAAANKRNSKKQIDIEQQSKLKRKESLSSNGGMICRICLGDENPTENPLIHPCKCDGTMKFIHIDCLREWLNSKSSFKENSAVKTYCWKALECELCKMRFPDRILSESGKSIDLISFEKPQQEYIVLESVTQQNIKIIHVIDMDCRDYIKVGRGHDSQVRITDISVSRCHALIKRSSRGDYILEDNNSKFGTLVLIRKPHMLNKSQANHLQLGRTVLEILIKDPTHYCSLRSMCSKNKLKAQKGTLSFDGEDFYPEEFMQKPHEFTREEEAAHNNGPIVKSSGRQLSHVQVVDQNFEDEVRRSQALENMTEQLQGNMNDEDEEEEYDEEEEEEDENEESQHLQSQVNHSRHRVQEAENIAAVRSQNIANRLIEDGENDLENSQTFLNPNLERPDQSSGSIVLERPSQAVENINFEERKIEEEQKSEKESSRKVLGIAADSQLQNFNPYQENSRQDPKLHSENSIKGRKRSRNSSNESRKSNEPTTNNIIPRLHFYQASVPNNCDALTTQNRGQDEHDISAIRNGNQLNLSKADISSHIIAVDDSLEIQPAADKMSKMKQQLSDISDKNFKMLSDRTVVVQLQNGHINQDATVQNIGFLLQYGPSEELKEDINSMASGAQKSGRQYVLEVHSMNNTPELSQKQERIEESQRDRVLIIDNSQFGEEEDSMKIQSMSVSQADKSNLQQKNDE